MDSSCYIGTSGWTYDDWAGVFYPPGVRGADRLPYYAGRFNTVEVNATFYRFPSAAMLAAWDRRLPPGFHVVLKGHRSITHLRRLRGHEDLLQRFLDSVLPLRRLRVILWQLPPTLQRDLPRLDRFLSGLPASVRHAVEFRHPSWWTGEVAALLAAHRCAMVTVSHPGLPDEIVPTTDFLYVRFHGLGVRLYDYDYSAAKMAGWAARLRPLLRGRTLYAYFNNDYHANAPRNAVVLRELLRGEQDTATAR